MFCNREHQEQNVKWIEKVEKSGAHTEQNVCEYLMLNSKKLKEMHDSMCVRRFERQT